MAQPLSHLVAGDWIHVGARRWPDRRCLVDGSGTARTYAEVADRVDRLATAMLEAGLRKGDRVAILATDSIAHMEVLLACFRAGTVFCDLNFRLRAPELANIMSRATPRAFFYDSRYADVIDELIEDLPPLAMRIVLDDDQYERTIAGTPPRIGIHSAAAGEDLVSIAFTSGTTGIPKGVMQSERMLRNIVYSGIREMRIGPGGFRYTGAPLFHISGIGSVLYTLAAGSTALILPQFDAETVLHWMTEGGLTHCTLIPTMISAILEIPGAKDAKFPALRSILYGGAPISPALLREVIAVFDCDLYNGFGAGTEAGGQTMLYPDEHRLAMAGREELLSSIGKPILGVDLRLCDDDLNEVPQGEIGEIVTRSETVMSGYLDQPELTARSIVDGWFRAGDMAWMDEEGYIYLATRKADMIIRGGENVYPVEIESVLVEHPQIVEASVVGVPDDHWGEVVAAAIVVRDPAAIDADEVRAHCRARLASYKVPEHVEVFPDLPKNSTGKLVKREIAEMVLRRLEARDDG